MNLTVNETIIKNVLNEKKLNEEIADFFNDFIQTELQKENPDCGLIDECVTALGELEAQSNAAASLRLVLTKKQVMTYCRRHARGGSAVKGIVAAALVLIMSGTAAFNASPAFAESVRSFFDSVVYSLQSLAEDTEDGDGKVVSIYAAVPEDAMNGIHGIDDVYLKDAVITAVYEDGSEGEIPLDSCKISKSIEQNGGKQYVLAVIAYKGCACSIAFELVREE